MNRPVSPTSSVPPSGISTSPSAHEACALNQELCHPDQAIELKARSLPFSTFHTRVDRIAPGAVHDEKRTQSTVTAYGRLEDPALVLRPEMTGYAYHRASKLRGLKALEVSVCQTSDGVLVCSHDKNTERATGVPYVIAQERWETLSTLMVSARTKTTPPTDN